MIGMLPLSFGIFSNLSINCTFYESENFIYKKFDDMSW